ncbi:BrnT family toxin [Luteibacter sp. RCC_6_2]|jgi:uncharacterized DUF497 family protein|uniref:BrnT family toxin n=1 Tax=Luteibacter sp. RCC_6_2 TaxID=3239223 RepID=UPI0035231A57
MVVTFEWDEAKALRNRTKHGISFENAGRIFLDLFFMTRLDDRVDSEDRYIGLGMVSGKELVVVYALRGESVRIISAREASRYEIFRYWQNRQACT